MKKDIDEEILTEIICTLDYCIYNCLLSNEMKYKIKDMIKELKGILSFMELK